MCRSSKGSIKSMPVNGAHVRSFSPVKKLQLVPHNSTGSTVFLLNILLVSNVLRVKTWILDTIDADYCASTTGAVKHVGDALVLHLRQRKHGDRDWFSVCEVRLC